MEHERRDGVVGVAQRPGSRPGGRIEILRQKVGEFLIWTEENEACCGCLEEGVGGERDGRAASAPIIMHPMNKDLPAFKREVNRIAKEHGVLEIGRRRFEGAEEGAEGCWNPTDPTVIWISEEYCADADDEGWPIIVAHELGHVVSWRPGMLPTNQAAKERAADNYMMELASKFGFHEAAKRIHEKHERNIQDFLSRCPPGAASR